MKRFKKVMAVLLVAIMVLGSTMTAFAAEKTESQKNLETKPLPVFLSYSRDDAGGSGTGGDEGDDSKRDIIDIALQYDNLNFDYKAASIVWNVSTKQYDVTLENTSLTKAIKVTNNSNVQIGVTPGINNEGATGVPAGFNFDFKRNGVVKSIAAVDNRANTSAMQVVPKDGAEEKVLGITNDDNVDEFTASCDVGENVIDSDFEAFEPEKITTITLAFRAASSNIKDNGQLRLELVEKNVYKDVKTQKIYITPQATTEQENKYDNAKKLEYYGGYVGGSGYGFWIHIEGEENPVRDADPFYDPETEQVFTTYKGYLVGVPTSAVERDNCD